LWPFTCYGYEKGIPCDITGDISPEELRFEAYNQLKQFGNIQQHTQMVNSLAQQMQSKRQALISKGSTQSNTNSSIFTSNTTNQSIFGNSSASAPTSQGIFGNVQHAPTSQSVFGNTALSSASPNNNIFGNNASSVFGQQPSPIISPPNSINLSPSVNMSPGTVSSGMMGQSISVQQNNTSLFGQSTIPQQNFASASNLFPPSNSTTSQGQFNSFNTNVPTVAPQIIPNSPQLPTNTIPNATKTVDSKLSQQSISAFTAEKFTFRNIPEEEPTPEFV